MSTPPPSQPTLPSWSPCSPDSAASRPTTTCQAVLTCTCDVDAMETIFAHPAVEVFVLVTGDSDYFPWRIPA
jgi:hypothetical protein